MNGGGATTLGVLLGVRFTFQCAIFCLLLYNLYLFMNLLEMLLYLFK